MIKNKHISKITMLTALFVAGVVNAQEFYTCVPKRIWWIDTMGESIKRNVPNADDIARAVSRAIPKPPPAPKKEYKLLYSDFFSSGILPPGKYMLKRGSDVKYFELFVQFLVKIEYNNTWHEYYLVLPSEKIKVEYREYYLYILK